MICPDCEEEVDKLTSNNTRCQRCATRAYQIEYMNKKNGTNKKYVPLKDLKGTKEYERAMKRRSGTKAEKKETKTDTIDHKMKYYLKVKEDLDTQFEKNKVNQNYLKIDLPKFIETFWNLLQEDSVILDAIKANKIFDDLSYLYLHNQLNIDWDNQKQILENSLYEKAVLELRRPTKDFIIYWKVMSEMVDAIKGNEVLMELIRKTRFDIKRTAENFEKPTYHTEIDNDLSKLDNIKVVEKSYKYFNVKVTVKGLYGHNYTETFKMDTPIYARDEAEAKTIFIDFMCKNFRSVKYKEDNIKIEEVKQ